MGKEENLEKNRERHHYRVPLHGAHLPGKGTVLMIVLVSEANKILSIKGMVHEIQSICWISDTI